MKPEDFSGLDVARYRLRLRALEDANLPAFLGSTLRGAFGHALKQAVCVMSHKSCERCMVEDRCLYPYLFETPPPEGAALLKGQDRAPHPFILTPPFQSLESAHPAYLPEAGLEPGLLQSNVTPTSGSQGLNRVPTGSIAAAPATIPLGVGPKPVPQCSATATQSPADSAVALPCHSQGFLSGSRPLPRLVKRPRHPVGRVETSFTPHHRTFLAAGESLRFDLVLLGRAIDYLPYIVFAVSEMARRGLGVGRVPFKLDEVTMSEPDGSERQIYSGRTERIATPALSRFTLTDWILHRLSAFPIGFEDDLSHPNSSSFPGPHPELCTPACSPFPARHTALRISFLTPTRIRVDGDPQSAPSFDLLVRSLLRRISMLMMVHGRGPLDVDYKGLISQATNVRIRSANLRWWDFERYSNRQQTKMKLGGFVGEIEYEGPAALLRQYLSLIGAGENLHVGSNTTFGLGLYQMGDHHRDAEDC